MEQLKSGQIVKIRRRLWRIDSVYKNELLGTSIDTINNFQKRFYIPLENIQPAEIDLPPFDKIGELSKQELLINAYRISLIHGASPLMSLQLSSVIPTNFQLVPVVMALNSARVRLLIADDVGLGKTIEAGLIINELIARHMVRKILIICPANLREQWQETLFDFFKLDFRIISSLHKRYLEKELPVGLSPWDYFQRLITSVDYAKTKANRNEILNYEWDLVIVDEAHLCARPHLASPSQTVSMQRWELLKAISPKAKHLLLLTATPHNGYTDNFASLIQTLDIGAADDKHLTFIDKEKARKHVCQRRRRDVVQWLKEEEGGFNPFPERDPKNEVRIGSLSRPEVKIYQMLREYGDQMMKLISAVNLQYIAQFTILHFLKRYLSSPQALRVSLKNRVERLTAGTNETEIDYDDALTSITETDNLENISTEEANQRIERSTFGERVSEFEAGVLNEIYEEAKKINPNNDSKYSKLIKEIIPELFQYAPKMIIFTRYKDTLEYLQKNLQKDLADCRILGIYGDMKPGPRKEVFAEFEHAPKAILVATDCISEGMNLQYLCSQVIHYELPWNPNRLEQRNGRVDRFGQPHKVHVRTIIVDGTLDEDILKKIIEKADRIKAEFGFSPPFFNDEKDILRRLIQAGKTPRTRRRDSPSQLSFFDLFARVQEDNKVDDSRDDDEQLNKQLAQIKSDSFYGHTDIRLPDIERRLRQTEKTIGSPEEIEKFIVSGLNLLNCSIRKTTQDTYHLILTDKRLILPGLSHQIDNVTFDKNYAARHPGVQLLDLSHPLISRLVQLLKQQMHLDTSQYGRTAYKISASITHPAAILKVLARYVVQTQPSSIVEEILTIGFNIYQNKILSQKELDDFEKNPPLPGRRTAGEFKEDMQEVFSNKYWEKALLEMIEENRQKMVADRQHLIETLSSSDLPSWLQGVTDILYASHDIISVTMGYPG